jgi:hypothetical protein
MYTLYNQRTGRITGHTTDSVRARSEPSIQGMYPDDVYYIERGQAVRYPPLPTSSFWHAYTWDSPSRSWVLDGAKTNRQARDYRTHLLGYVDKISPVWWSNMSVSQQQSVTEFRQKLLDITGQDNYPVTIDWPTIPIFLRN